MKTLIICAGLITSLAFTTGCEWTSGGSVDAWNTSTMASWVDFSGSYKAPDGGILVRAFGSSETTNQVATEQIGTGTGSATAFAGILAHTPVPGTLTITVGAYRFTDSASSTSSVGTVSLTVTPADGSTGTLNYGTRAWALTFPAPIASGSAILANYYYTEDASQGNHGKPIYSFIVYQTGNRLQLVDSNNGNYEGNMGNVAGTTNNSPVVAQFSAMGISQGYNVTIVGTFQGTTVGGETIASRTMNATFIEEAGSQADIHAVAQ